MTLKVVILGANGFIGSALTNAILRTRPWEVYGMDLGDNKLAELSSNPRFHFVEGDISINREWIEYHVKKCDVVVPLVAIANPAQYVQRPAARVRARFRGEPARSCASALKYRKRLVFPSTSEIYGMCAGRGARRGDELDSSTARSTSSAGSTPAPSSCSTA